MSETTPSGTGPYVPPDAKVAELRPVPLIVGVLLGILFGASSLYLALKVGMTVSASIPIAVLSITIFRGLSYMLRVRRATILENNLVQTTGSSGESIAFGVAVTMPALMILGFDMEVGRVMLVAVLGGLLGILMMIPLRRALIVKEHGHLVYPEGTACAQVLIAGEEGGSNAKTVFAGFGAGFFYKVLMSGMHLWKEIPEKLLYRKAAAATGGGAVTGWNGAAVACEVTPELLGVGYIIGPRIACIMVAGGILSSLVLIPAIKLFGATSAVLFPAGKPIADMAPPEIWRSYVLYIGAGAVAAGGIISLGRALPTIVRGARAGLRSLRAGGGAAGAGAVPRTDQDISMRWVLGGMLALVGAIWVVPALHMNLLGSILVVLFGFLFVTVSSRLTGEIGSSSNPISGMTVATLLSTCLVFLALGWTTPADRVTALSVAAVVCIAASNGGTTSQDLKTGFLVGATPRWQQIGILVGSLTSALVIGWTLLVLNQASTVYAARSFPGYTAPAEMLGRTERLSGPEGKRDGASYRVLQLPEGLETAEAKIPPGKYLVDAGGSIRYLVDPGINGVLDARDDGSRVAKYEAPKARLMSLIIDGILTQRLPWGLVLLGVFIALVLELCGVSSLPFAVGVYLPLSSSAPIFVGGAVRWLVDRRVKHGSAAEAESSSGVLLSSGLIAGGAIAGIGVALLALWQGAADALHAVGKELGALAQSNLLPVVMFALLVAFVYAVGRGRLLGGRRS